MSGPSRTRFHAVLALALCTVALAGCISPSDGPSADGASEQEPSDPRALPGPFTLTACVEQFGLFTIQASEAEPYLPDGFELAGISGTPLPEGTAHLVVLTYTCENPQVGATVTEFSADLVVEPPEAYRNDDAGDHYVSIVALTTSPSILETYHAWGLSTMQEGEIVLDATVDTPVASAWESHAAAGTDEARLTTTTQGPPSAMAGGEVRIFGVQDGAVTGAVDIDWTEVEGGYGEASLEDGGLLPVAADEPGLGGHFWGFEETFSPVDLAEIEEART